MYRLRTQRTKRGSSSATLCCAVCLFVTMVLQVLLITFLKVALVGSVREVTGYPGDTVTLPSGADPSWNLSKIEWSVFPNNTWIATYRNKEMNIERFYLYKGRLSLNITSGDLTIRDVNTKDDMEYSVDLFNTARQVIVNKVKLTVKQRLQKPTIETFRSKTIKGGCRVVLKCSSADEGVNLTWEVESQGVTDNSRGPFLSAYISITQKPAKFTCISRKNTETESEVITPECDDDKPQPTPQQVPPSRSRYYVALFMGGLVGGSLTGILLYLFKEGKRNPCHFMREKMFKSKTSSSSEA